MSEYIVMESLAKMPLSCWGKYVRVAVVELEEGFTGRPKTISERARGVKRVVRVWEKRFDGKTPRCAAVQARIEAGILAEDLNNARVTS